MGLDRAVRRPRGPVCARLIRYDVEAFIVSGMETECSYREAMYGAISLLISLKACGRTVKSDT